MLTVENKPTTYRSTTDWYAADWSNKTAFVFTSKAKAVEKAKTLETGAPHQIVNVGWIPKGGDGKFHIGNSFNVTDLR